MHVRKKSINMVSSSVFCMFIKKEENLGLTVYKTEIVRAQLQVQQQQELRSYSSKTLAIFLNRKVLGQKLFNAKVFYSHRLFSVATSRDFCITLNQTCMRETHRPISILQSYMGINNILNLGSSAETV